MSRYYFEMTPPMGAPVPYLTDSLPWFAVKRTLFYGPRRLADDDYRTLDDLSFVRWLGFDVGESLK